MSGQAIILLIDCGEEVKGYFSNNELIEILGLKLSIVPINLNNKLADKISLEDQSRRLTRVNFNNASVKSVIDSIIGAEVDSTCGEEGLIDLQSAVKVIVLGTHNAKADVYLIGFLQELFSEAVFYSIAGASRRICDIPGPFNCRFNLEHAGIKTLADLSEKTEAELRSIKGLGAAKINRIKEVLAEDGLTLRRE